MSALRDRIDPYSDKYLAGKARARRAQLFLQTFPELDSMRVLDLGGIAAMWESMAVVPERVVLMNKRAHPVPAGGVFTSISGDACDPPGSILGETFDLVFSNSVIEHVGGHDRRLRFAETVHALAPRHWIQTPNRYFPVEPHWMLPGFQFLPSRVKADVMRVWPGHYQQLAADATMRMGCVLSAELLTKAEFSFYFPTSDVLTERLFGLSKSLIAVKS